MLDVVLRGWTYRLPPQSVYITVEIGRGLELSRHIDNPTTSTREVRTTKACNIRVEYNRLEILNNQSLTVH